MSHPSRRLDDAVHQRTRLGILAVLCEVDRADFAYVRTTLELTDGNLSSNVAKLEEAGYVAVEKVADGRRPRTWLTVTRPGRAALAAELAALQEIISAVEESAAAARRRHRRPRPA